MRVSIVTMSMMAASPALSEQQGNSAPPSECEVMLDTLQRHLILINANLNELARRVAEKDKTTLLGARTSSWRYNTEGRPKKQLSWDSQLRYMRVVEEKETELQRLRESCHKLMATHITHQMKKIKDIEQKLQTSMQARLAREKEERAKKRRPMVRSDLSAIPSPPAHLYKGAYYRLAESNHYKQQSKHGYGRQHQQVQRVVEHSEPATAESPALQLEESTSSVHEEKEESIYEEPPLQLPPLIPLVDILGAHDNREKLSQMRYSNELRHIASTQRLLKHMFNTVHTHQTIASSYSRPQQLPPLPRGRLTARHHSSIAAAAAVSSHKPSKLLRRIAPLAAAVQQPDSTDDNRPVTVSDDVSHSTELQPAATPAPLSVENLLSGSALPVKESKRPSLLWTNYLH